MLLSNCLIIFGTAFLAIKILDWYNPLMDFSGQSGILQICLGVCAVISGIFNIFAYRESGNIPKKAKPQLLGKRS